MRPIFILTKKVVENLLNDFFRYNFVTVTNQLA